MKIFAFLFSVLFVACQCNDILCESGPPDINFQLVDSIGSDPILAGVLSIENIVLHNIQNQTSTTPKYFMGVISFPIDNISADYELSVNSVIQDTLKITTILSEGECCSSFRIGNVSIENQTVEFRPFVKIEI